ncbi:hypothetical protein PHMEG_00037332, partial [Phytophthora megakarya]
LTSGAMTTAIKKAAASAGKNPRLYGTHSMRSGGATAMFVSGVDRLVIKHFGRWRSDCYEQYTRMDGATISNLSSKMVGIDPIQAARTDTHRLMGPLHAPRRTPRLEFLTALNILTTAPKRAI